MTTGNTLNENGFNNREKIPFDPKVCPIFMFTAGKILSGIHDKATGELLGTIIHEKSWEINGKGKSKDIIDKVGDTMAICETCKNAVLHSPEISFGTEQSTDGSTVLYAGISLDGDISMPITNK